MTTPTILTQLQAFEAAIASDTSAEAQTVAADIKSLIASTKAYVPVLAANMANVGIADLAIKFPPAAFLVPLEGGVIDPFIKSTAANFENFILGKIGL